MDALHAFLIAVIQGLTEFLPISSSAHLVLLPIFMEWQDQGVVIDIAAHFGSLLAVVFYFRRDLSNLIRSWFQSFGVENKSDEARLAWNIILATIPIFIVALLVQAYLLAYVRNAVVIVAFGSGSVPPPSLYLAALGCSQAERRLRPAGGRGGGGWRSAAPSPERYPPESW